MALKPLIGKCAGINNKLDPRQLRHNDPKTGITDLAECENWDINDAGYPEVRLGQESLPTEKSHSIFCDGEECYVAQDRTSDTAIFQVTADFGLTSALKTGLTEGEYLSWCQAGPMSLYANGFENGMMICGAHYSWPANVYPTVTNRADKTKVYSSVPVGHLICYHKGRAWVAIDEDGKFPIYCSLPYRLGTFRKSKYFFQLKSHIRMMRPVAGGVWVSDSDETGFITSSPLWKDHLYEQKSSFPAHEWSACQRLVDLSKSHLQIPGLCAIWSSDEGMCIGTSDGQLIVETKERLIYPTGSNGATVVDNLNVINSVW